MKKELAWKKSLRMVGDNPDHIYDYWKAIEKELKLNNPDISYLKEKANGIQNWIDEIKKSHWEKGRGFSKIKKVV